MARFPGIRSLRFAGLVRPATAALVVLAAQLVAPAARAGDEADASCPATAQRENLASTASKLEEIQKRIMARGANGQNVVAVPNGGYSYSAPQNGSDAALLEFEAKQREATPPAH